jgi:hypothetical protein
MLFTESSKSALSKHCEACFENNRRQMLVETSYFQAKENGGCTSLTIEYPIHHLHLTKKLHPISFEPEVQTDHRACLVCFSKILDRKFHFLGKKYRCKKI